MDGDVREGRCLCGAVVFEIGLPTKWCAHCHCSMCRRAHGAPFVTWVGVKASRFEVTRGADDLVRFASSGAAWRSFCGRCGSTLLFGGERWPDEVHVVMANVDGELDRAPQANSYWEDHVTWGLGVDELPKLGGATGTEPIPE